MVVFGTRPEAIKMAPVVAKINQYPDQLECLVVSTGQHREMLDPVLKLFNIQPHYDLNIMEKSQSINQIISKTILGLPEIFNKDMPDMVLVHGDTSTAFASALAAYYGQIPIGHVEAGLRTGDKYSPYPEEVNRHLISVIADLNFAPTKTAASALLKEGIVLETISVTGNTVIDALMDVASRPFDLSSTGIELLPDHKLVLATLHRRESFGPSMQAVCEAFKQIAKEKVQIILPMHKNPKVREVVLGTLSGLKNITLIEPMDYEPFVHLMKRAYLILTDSGGIQEEAPSLGKPVLVLREKTERPEAIAAGAVKLVGVSKEKIIEKTLNLLRDQAEYNKMTRAINPYGDGKASGRIVEAIINYYEKN